MDQPHYDPRTKQQIKEAIYAMLYEPVQRHMQQRLDVLIMNNTLLGKFTHKSFVYKGITYSCDETRPPLKRNPLLAQLKPMMDEYLAEVKELNERELPFVLGFINQVLNASDGLTDYLRIFPELVHEPVKRMISICPCQNQKLSDDQVNALQAKNETSISLIKRRMTTNLLLG